MNATAKTADQSSDRAERRLRIVQELAEIGMDLARALRTRALAAKADPAAAVDLGLSFSRVARAVRQTVALEARLDQDRQAAAAERAERRARDAREHGYKRKARIRGLVERAIDEASGEAAEDLLSELDVTPPPALWDEAEWGLAGGGAKGPLHISSAPEAEPGTGRADAAWPDPTAAPVRTRSP
jgi:hypothetical protein